MRTTPGRQRRPTKRFGAPLGRASTGFGDSPHPTPDGAVAPLKSIPGGIRAIHLPCQCPSLPVHACMWRDGDRWVLPLPPFHCRPSVPPIRNVSTSRDMASHVGVQMCVACDACIHVQMRVGIYPQTHTYVRTHVPLLPPNTPYTQLPGHQGSPHPSWRSAAGGSGVPALRPAGRPTPALRGTVPGSQPQRKSHLRWERGLPDGRDQGSFPAVARARMCEQHTRARRGRVSCRVLPFF